MSPRADSELVHISTTDWFYSGRRLFTFVHQVWIDGSLVRTDQTDVKTRDLVEALEQLGLVERIPAGWPPKKGTPRKRRVTTRKPTRR